MGTYTWFLSFNAASMIGALVCTLAWVVGGCLLIRASFNLRAGEVFFTGTAAGWVINLVLINVFARWLGVNGAAFLAAGLILAAGLVLNTRQLRLFDWRAALRVWPQLLVLLGFTYVFWLAQQGVSIFDDYLHIPLVSIMGAGEIPPHFYLNPDTYFSYHYGLQVWSAALVSQARMQPWAAWDLSKSFALALTLLLAWTWLVRLTKSRLAGLCGSALFVFAGGTRWLLLLLPAPIQAWLDSGIRLVNTGADTAQTLSAALASPWVINGEGKMPFPFAYHNGMFVPVFFILGSTGALPFVIVLLLLLLVDPAQSSLKPANLARLSVLILLLAGLALSAEHLFAFLWVGIALALVFSWILGRLRKTYPPSSTFVWGWVLILAFSALLSAVQGGYITEKVREILLQLQGINPAVSSDIYRFGLRWPPGFYSAHLGVLSIFEMRQLFVMLFEMGPVILLAPLVTRFSWREVRRQNWLTAGLGISAALGMVFGLLVQYGVDRSTTRLPGTALWLWLVLGFPLLWIFWKRASRNRKVIYGLACAVVLVGGIVIFSIQLANSPVLQPAYYLDDLDLRMSNVYWNKLEPSDQVLNDMPERAVAVFGRIARTNHSIYGRLPEAQTLIQNPTPAAALRAGFRYIYMDRSWWDSLTENIHLQLSQPCVKILREVNDSTEDYRKLLDLSACQP